VATFKEAVGNASAAGAGCALASGCCACGANETTPSAGSVHSDACVCLAGYAGAGCAPCALGSYKTAASSADCEACPEGKRIAWLNPSPPGFGVSAQPNGATANTSA
jgi:hypothetical protein